MKILITGTTGFLGRSLADYFGTTHEVIEHTRTSVRLSGAIYIHKPDLIIHCAGEIYKTDVMYDTNVGMVNEILESVREYCPGCRVIQIGSSAEYGPMNRATSETDPINPVDVYQATKGAATLLCQAYARQYGLKTMVARIYSGYGIHERPHRLFPTLYRAFFNDEPMTLYQGYHDFIYIEDFVRAIDQVKDFVWEPGEIINFGSGRQHSNFEVLEAWERITGRTAPVEKRDQLSKAYESTVWVCDNTKLRIRCGFQLQYDLEAGIQDFIKKMQNVKTN
jgi:nucleoside-diphosphate-sugar epimerase